MGFCLSCFSRINKIKQCQSCHATCVKIRLQFEGAAVLRRCEENGGGGGIEGNGVVGEPKEFLPFGANDG